MSRTAVVTSRAPGAIGAYSQAVKAGDTVYLSGQIALDPQTMTLVSADPKTQIERVFANLAEVAAAAGGSFAEITKLNVYLTDLAHFALVNEVMESMFESPYPARAAVGVATLPTIDLIDTSCLYVRAPIDEVDAGKVEKGLPAYISLDAFPGVQYPAVVTRVAPYVLDLEKQARTVDVEVEFRDIEEAGRLLVGYSADVEIILEAHEDTLRIPTEALLEGRRVLLYRDGVLAERKVEAGLENWESTEVLSGLEEGDRIVLTVDRDGVGAGASVAPEEPPATDG